MKTRRLILFCAFIACAFLSANDLHAQYATSLTVTDHQNPTLAKKIEQNGSQLLTSFNDAFFANKEPKLNFGGISKADIEDIHTIWEMTPFRCLETELIERLYKTQTGYQVRNVPIFLKGVPEEDAERDVVINFDRNGNISNVYFALSFENINEILYSEDGEVTDMRERQVILDFVENYRTAHNRKDIKMIEQVFSNDALIITGKVLKAKPSEMNNFFSGEEVEYLSKTKGEYISSLKKVFSRNQMIDVKFDQIQVQRHPKHDSIYGVNLKQHWSTSTYSDVGYVFLLIDFRDGIDNPLIKVRTWQPNEYGGKKIDEDEIFTLGNLPKAIK